MNEKIQWSRFLSLVVLTTFLLPVGAVAEYYSYVDRNGTTHFVDDAGKIPKEYRKKKQLRKDKYDDLQEEERALLLEKERWEREASRARDEELSARKRQERDEQERQRTRERLLEELTTHVVIAGNQVLVPVTLANGSVETEALLLLDTGATSSVISPEVAARLNIEKSDNVNIGVVGGKVLRARKVVLDHIKVGPVKRAGQPVIIVRKGAWERGDGLLGMSFLGGIKYTIDFKKQVINWIPN